MLAEEVKNFTVLYDKQVKGYKDRDVVTTLASDLEFIEHGKIYVLLFLSKHYFKAED